MKLHTAGEDYLEAVLILQKKLGMVRSVDVARYMEVSKPSVCCAVGTLREGGFLTTEHAVSDESFQKLKEHAMRGIAAQKIDNTFDNFPVKK